MNTFASDIDDLKALGVGALSLVNAAIVVAILAVVLSTKSQTANLLKTFFQFLAYLVSGVVAPISGGTNVALTSTLQPSGPVGAASASPGDTVAASSPSSSSASSGFPGSFGTAYPDTNPYAFEG